MLVGLCKSGNLKGLESLQERSIVDLSSRPIYKYMAAASEGGFVDILDWWVGAVSTVESTRHDRKRNGRPCHPNEGLQAAAMAGHWHVFQWWRTYEPQDMLHMELRFLTMCRHGHVDLLSRASLCFRIYLDDDFPEYMDEASAAGHVEVLDWIMTHSESPGYTHKAMDEASRNGHLHVLDWWAQSGLPLKFTSSAKVDAVRAGKTDIVNWYNSFPLYRTLLCSSLLPDSPAPSAIRTADLVMLASFGALPWIRAAIGDDILSVSHVVDTSAFYRAIARSGHVHIMDKYNSDLRDNEDVEPCLQLAAQYDHIQVWRYLIDEMYTDHDYDPDFSDLWKSCVHVAAEHGSLDILEVLMINIKTRPLASDFLSVVAAACKGGSIKALQFLIDNKYWTAGSLSQHDMQAALRAAAAHGRIEVLQWWYSKSQQQVSAFLVFSRD
ncbi:hypothetical protein BCR44DRAFT_1295227 [Catenaria anguillulae PL171]|uniref:Ankyrin repeat-containing domain protein n=1 Tax=Catenaria anguillulae PL171 TaxID=765915 RepID=A0A1Y2HVD6_9FUNG|nr:hypothetical protein BCR44DRAFT_1295227 [Catenaria anguillulae PL171]